MSGADRSRRYRDRLRADGKLGKSGKSGKSGKTPSKFDAGEFIAVDGEGFNMGPVQTRKVGAYDHEYSYRDHHYAYLSCSDGAELYNREGRLTSKSCLDFLLAITERAHRSIAVCFGASYDMCHMLAFDLTRDEIDQLIHGDGRIGGRRSLDITLEREGEKHDYRLELRVRKSLSVWRWPHGADKYQRHRKRDGGVNWRLSSCRRVVLWDVWGFFQGSFVGALQTWLPQHPDTPLITRMKLRRSTFDRSELATVREYNTKELDSLVLMMNKVRDAVRAMGLRVSRWDGAGAIAKAMMREHGVKDHMAVSPSDVFEAARHAYSGGHIEAIKIGYHRGKVHHNDINSAYPHQFRHLPGLVHGDWRHGVRGSDGRLDVPAGFTLVRVTYRFRPGLPFYPLFYRNMDGSIVYPERGHGWYWYPEYECARDFSRLHGFIEFDACEFWHFAATGNVRPFAFIEDYYDQRRAIVNESKRTGIPNGVEKMLKLGYNAVYGATAQQVGVRRVDGILVPPTYFQLEWAGYVTAGCRAQLMRAAMQNPAAIISFATDSIFSTEPLDVNISASKELGAWSNEIHAGMTIVMPGVYWLHDDKTTHFSRGFDKETMKECDFVHKAWSRKQSLIDVPSERMVTLGTACMSENFWDMRGLFVKTTRSLQLSGDNSKRYPVALHNKQLHKGLYDTHPRDLIEDYDTPLTNLMSEPYPIEWMKYEDASEDALTADNTGAERSFIFDREALLLA